MAGSELNFLPHLRLLRKQKWSEASDRHSLRKKHAMGSDDSDTCRVTERIQKVLGVLFVRESECFSLPKFQKTGTLIPLLFLFCSRWTRDHNMVVSNLQYQPTHHGIEPWMSCCSCVSIIIWRGTMILFYACLLSMMNVIVQVTDRSSGMMLSYILDVSLYDSLAASKGLHPSVHVYDQFEYPHRDTQVITKLPAWTSRTHTPFYAWCSTSSNAHTLLWSQSGFDALTWAAK